MLHEVSCDAVDIETIQSPRHVYWWQLCRSCPCCWGHSEPSALHGKTQDISSFCENRSRTSATAPLARESVSGAGVFTNRDGTTALPPFTDNSNSAANNQVLKFCEEIHSEHNKQELVSLCKQVTACDVIGTGEVS